MPDVICAVSARQTATTMMRHLPHAMAASLLLCAIAHEARAQLPAGAQAARQACMAAYERYCSDVQPGGGRVKACLEQNEADLAPECRQALEAADKM